MSRPGRPALRARQRGAALLLAMMVLVLIATLAAGMIYQQDRAIRVETAERAREQAEAVSAGALEIARLILRDDVTKNNNKIDHLGEAWANELPETEVSTLVSSDERSPTDREGLRAFVSGQIHDAQAKFNLRNLYDDEGKPVAASIEALQRLCQTAGVGEGVADRIAAGLVAASLATKGATSETAPLMPTRLAQLSWLGIEPAVIRRLEPYVTLLPVVTKVNANTASEAVLLAVVPGINTGQAGYITRNQQKGLKVPADLQKEFQALLASKPGALDGLGQESRYFEVDARLRIGDVSTAERWLLWRDNTTIKVLRHEVLLPPSALRR